MQTTTTQFKTPRFEALDGLRGIAIFLVVSFHVFNLHPTLLPFPESVNQFVLFETG